MYECCHFVSSNVSQNMLNKAEHVAKAPNTSRVRYIRVLPFWFQPCVSEHAEEGWNMWQKAPNTSLANLLLLCIVCLEELKINLKQRSTAFAQLLIKQQNEACGWKYLHSFYVFELTCIFTSDPPLNRKQTKTWERQRQRQRKYRLLDM